MIRFSRYLLLYLMISGLVIIPGLFSLFTFGLKPAIDFSGGTLLELKFNKSIGQNVLAQAAAANNLELSSVQSTNTDSYIIRSKNTENQKLSKFTTDINKIASVSAQVVRQDTVGPILGQELLVKAVIAAVLAIIGIMLYIAYAFKNPVYGFAAIVALLHDLLVVIGSFSLLGRLYGVEVDTLFVTAILTTMSFSVHDTIVVFDRIREYRRKLDRMPLEDLSDRALTETMSRSLANSMTILIMLTALILIGGETVRWFAVALLIGTVSGTYSSPFVATPVLLLISRRQARKLHRA